VAGLVTIESDVELRELAHFKTASVSAPDIRIRVGIVAPRPSTRVMFDNDGDRLTYREHLGPLSANFAVTMGDPIVIRVAPMLALSPHVVYTNVVEAFLRFLLVSKGYVLLHSAAIADEHGVSLLSAQTDTGKTSTVISLVRSRGYRFLSDDMTIIDPGGIAISYPKPMTLSFHTMSVAKDGRLTRRDRAELAVQSRLHSKGGRTVGRSLGNLNIPIMTLNSLVQLIVPPPKYRIDALFDCEVGGRGPIRNVVLMSRGEPSVERPSLAATVQELLENTDDAYGFPPFSTFAPHIRIGADDYDALRRKEIELLTRAISGVSRWRVSVSGHEWADVLPSIFDGERGLTSPGSPGPALDRESTSPAPDPVPVFTPLAERIATAAKAAIRQDSLLPPAIPGAESAAPIHASLDPQPTGVVSQ
jgi:dolichol-phosphate mannosyltransferase